MSGTRRPLNLAAPPALLFPTQPSGGIRGGFGPVRWEPPSERGELSPSPQSSGKSLGGGFWAPRHLQECRSSPASSQTSSAGRAEELLRSQRLGGAAGAARALLQPAPTHPAWAQPCSCHHRGCCCCPPPGTPPASFQGFHLLGAAAPAPLLPPRCSFHVPTCGEGGRVPPAPTFRAGTPCTPPSPAEITSFVCKNPFWGETACFSDFLPPRAEAWGSSCTPPTPALVRGAPHPSPPAGHPRPPPHPSTLGWPPHIHPGPLGAAGGLQEAGGLRGQSMEALQAGGGGPGFPQTGGAARFGVFSFSPPPCHQPPGSAAAGKWVSAGSGRVFWCFFFLFFSPCV